MKKMPFLTIMLSLILFFSISACKRQRNDEKLINALEDNLASSNTSISISTEIALKSLEEKTTDYCTKERAEIWYPKAVLIAEASRDLFNYLEKIKPRKKVNAQVSKEILQKILQYKLIVISTDSDLMIEFEDRFRFINRFILLAGGDTSKNMSSLKYSYLGTSATSLLTMLQNDIKVIENKAIYYCNTKVGCTGWDIFGYSAIVGQNSSYLSPGSELEIKAGVGAFSKAARPEVFFSNRNIEVGEEGYSTYRIKVSNTPGKYNIPVRIKFFDQTIGKEEEVSYNVKYIVAKPCDQ